MQSRRIFFSWRISKLTIKLRVEKSNKTVVKTRGGLNCNQDSNWHPKHLDRNYQLYVIYESI